MSEETEPEFADYYPEYKKVLHMPNEFTVSPEEQIEMLSKEYQCDGQWLIDQYGHVWVQTVTPHGYRMVRRLYYEVMEFCNEYTTYDPSVSFISTVSYEMPDSSTDLKKTRLNYEVRIEVVDQCPMTGKVHFTMSMKADDLQPDYIEDHRKELDRRLNFLFSNAKFVLNQDLDDKAVAQMSPRYKELK